jgi:hypothetical protein
VNKFDHHCQWVNNCIGAKNLGLFYLFLWLIWLSIVMAVIVTCEVYVYGSEASGTSGVPYSFSIFVAAVVGLIAVFAFFPVSLLVYSHSKNFLSGKTTSETLSKAGYRFQDVKRSKVENCYDMCCNRESQGSYLQANEKYRKDLEVTLKDYN